MAKKVKWQWFWGGRWKKRLAIVLLFAFVAVGAYDGLNHLIKARNFQFFGNVIARQKTEEKLVALTFDDGPQPDTTRELIEILKRNNAKATFFQVGKNIAWHPELTRAVAASGNEIGNHSYNHRSMALMSYSSVAKEIETTTELIKQNGYTKPVVLFRPPFGDKLLTLPYYASRHGLTTVMFDINPDDHAPEELNPDKIVTEVMAKVKPGSIIVMHPEYKHRRSSLLAVEPIIKNLRLMGYRFVTVSELMKR